MGCGFQCAGPGRALDGDLGVEDPGEVGPGREQHEEHGQDDGKLDDRLAAAPGSGANEREVRPAVAG